MASKMQAVLLTCLFIYLTPVSGMLEGLYCGLDNCYEILGTTRDAEKTEITKNYRKLARKWHPDMHKGEEKKEEASEMFQKIANAYEILKDEESRKDYDYMLDNPEEFYMNYYRYYRRRYGPKVDVRIVIAFIITMTSVIQYYSGWKNYNTAIDYFLTVPKYRMQAQEIAVKEGLINPNRKKDKTKTKEEIKEEEEKVLRGIIENKMDIRGSYGKPTMWDVLWVQMFTFPLYLVKYIAWFARWIWKFTICRHEYGEEEKEYIIRKNMQLSQGQWDALEDHEKEDFMDKELWMKEKFAVWKEERDAQQKAELAQNARYKAYRRYMKKGGAGQMAFGPE